jgi:hypothetical protein
VDVCRSWPSGWALALLIASCSDDAGSPPSDGATETGGDATIGDGSGSASPGDGTSDDDGDESESESGGDDTTGGGEPPPTTVSRPAVLTDIGAPQMVAVRKSPTQLGDAAHEARCLDLLPQLAGLPFLGNANTCTIFHPNVLDSLPDPTERRTYFAAGFEEARTMVGAEHVASRRLTLEISLDLLDAEPERVEEYLVAMLDGARESKLPVVVNLDTVSWWARRPDLWNFFDPEEPGYDPANIDNVEWIGPTGEGAPQVYWRNWGSQIRVATPIPNISSPKLRAEIGDVLDRVLPRISEFRDELADDEQYRFGGVIIGTELAIGVNHYYYPGGNAHLGADPACDPGLPLQPGCPAGGGPCSGYNHAQCPPDFEASPSGGVAQVGYHGAIDLGLLAGGGAPGRPELDAIVTDYIAFMADEIAAAGLPATKVYSHTGGTFGPNGPQSYDAAHVAGVVPGWSMYGGGASNPSSSVASYVESNDDRRVLPWSSPEWLPFDPNGDASLGQWQTALEDSLSYRNNRMVSVANWEGISTSSAAVGALGAVMTTPRADACAVIAREVIGQADAEAGVRLRLSDPAPGTVTYFTASSSSALAQSGTLADIDTVNAVLDDGAITYDMAVPPAGQTTWVQVVTDGCLRDGATQRMVSPLYAVSADRVDGSLPTADLVLFASRDQPIATLSWLLPTDVATLSLQLSRTSDFAVLEDAIDVTGSPGFVRDGFDDEHPLFARVLADGAASNTVTLR